MKRKQLRLIQVTGALLAFSCCAYAQGPATALANSKQNYSKQLDQQSRLFNGIKYVEYPEGFTGTAYYLSSEFQNANLHYDGTDLYNVPMLYDLYKELVVVKYPADQSLMSLSNNKLDRFSIGDHTFIRIDADNTPKSLSTGFYELLHDGRSRLVKKYTKDIQQEHVGLVIKNVFNEHTSYYLLKNNVYYSVSGKRTVINVLKDKKKELEEYLKANKASIGDDDEQAMIKIAAYYDQLTK